MIRSSSGTKPEIAFEIPLLKVAFKMLFSESGLEFHFHMNLIHICMNPTIDAAPRPTALR